MTRDEVVSRCIEWAHGAAAPYPRRHECGGLTAPAAVGRPIASWRTVSTPSAPGRRKPPCATAGHLSPHGAALLPRPRMGTVLVPADRRTSCRDADGAVPRVEGTLQVRIRASRAEFWTRLPVVAQAESYELRSSVLCGPLLQLTRIEMDERAFGWADRRLVAFTTRGWCWSVR